MRGGEFSSLDCEVVHDLLEDSRAVMIARYPTLYRRALAVKQRRPAVPLPLRAELDALFVDKATSPAKARRAAAGAWEHLHDPAWRPCVSWTPAA